MHRAVPVLGVLCLFFASPFVAAQDKLVEISGIVGYAFSNGIDVQTQEVDGVFYNRVSPKSSFAFDVGIDFFLSEGFSLGFNWGRQESKLTGRAINAPDRDFTDMNVDNYHGIFAFTFGDEDSELRPYIFGGLGATRYVPGDIDGFPVNARTRFSTTWGGGIKIYPMEHFGFKGGVRWTPTYITSTPGGTWCNPWYCWIVGDPHYSHQFEMSGGVIARF